MSPLAWHVVDFGDGDAHLAVPAADGATVKALCGLSIRRPLAVLKQDPHQPPPDPEQACQECAAAFHRRTKP